LRQVKLRAVFMRGGTSRAIMFRRDDLPADRDAWAPIFLAAIGSPDPNGRQLDGMGGGISSLSKVCVVGPARDASADVDYTFAQVSIKEAAVDYSGNCGNMSSAVGPFAIDEAMVAASGAEAVVRIHNTNTSKLIIARFPMDDGAAAVDGDLRLPGVAGSGAPVRLDFMDPGGAGTGRLLPTGNASDMLEIPGASPIAASMIDAANPCVFVAASALGMTGVEMPEALEANRALLDLLEAIRRTASVRMGIAPTPEAAARIPSIPKVALIAPPLDAPTLSGDRLAAGDCDLTVRMVSIGQPHRAVPLTGAMCLAVAARIPGTVAHRLARASEPAGSPIRIAQPSGLTVVDAQVDRTADQWIARRATVYRTARRLMDGYVYIRACAISPSPRAR